VGGGFDQGILHRLGRALSFLFVLTRSRSNTPWLVQRAWPPGVLRNSTEEKTRLTAGLACETTRTAAIETCRPEIDRSILGKQLRARPLGYADPGRVD